MGIFSGIGKFLFGLGSSAAQHPTSVIKAGTQVATGNIGGAADTLLSAYESDQARSQQMKDSKAMMKYQNDLNIANWNMQNEYNTPSNQLKRLQEAGINPLMVMPDTGTASQPSAVSGQPAPDISSLLQYQLQAQLQHEQVKLLKQQERSQRIENEAAEAEKDLRVANAKDELREGSRPGTPPDDRDGWQYSDGTWVLRYTGPNNEYYMEIVPGDNIRQESIRARLKRDVTDYEAAKIAKSAAEIERNLRKKFGEQLTQAQINQLSAIALQASVAGQLDKLDLDLLKKIGVGNSIASPVLKQILTTSGKIAAKAILKN